MVRSCRDADDPQEIQENVIRSKLHIRRVLFCLPFFLLFPRFAAPETRIDLWEFPRWRDNEDQRDRFAWIKRQIARFERLHPDTEVELTELTWEGGYDKRRIALMAGAGPDVSSGPIPIDEIEAGYLEPADDFMTQGDLADYVPAALESWRYNGRVWGWPWFVTGSIIFLNLDIFAERGVTPPGPEWTYAEMVEIARRLTFDRDGGGGTDVYGLGMCAQPGDTTLYPFWLRQPADFQEQMSAPATVERLEDLMRLATVDGLAPPSSGGMTSEDLWTMFAQERRIAMAPWGIWAVPALRKLAESVGEPFRFSVAPYPDIDGPSHSIIAASGFMVFRQPDAARREACMEFARFLTSAENQRALSGYGVFPARRSAGDIYPDDPVMRAAGEILIEGAPTPRDANWPRIDERIQRQVQLALLGHKDAAAALLDARDEIRSLKDRKQLESKRAMSVLVVYLVILVAGTVCLAAVLFAGRGRGVARQDAQARSAYLFLLPGLAAFAVFIAYPVARGILLAFQHYQPGLEARVTFVGLDNFRSILADGAFLRGLANTVFYAAIVVPTKVVVALILASLIYPLSRRTAALFRGAFYLPGVASVVVVAMIWRWLFNENVGILNQAVQWFGGAGVPWLSSPSYAMKSVVLTGMLGAPGAAILIYVASMASIPRQLVEASRVDGAGVVRSWWHVTVPLLRPATLFIFVTTTIASLQIFAPVLILTDGGPGYSSTVLVHRIYVTAFRDFDFGSASAMAVVLFVVVMAISVFQFRLLRTRTVE